MTRVRVGIALGLMLVLGLSGCGMFSGAPTADIDPSASQTLTDEERGIKYAQCMREHGIDMPDPKPGDGISLDVPAGTNPADVDAAAEACKQWLPGSGEPHKPDPAALEKVRAYAKCMRENGMPNFPDPDENGNLKVEGGPGDPGYDQAQAACKHLMGPGGELSDNGGGK